jgi:hypothetical protein
MRATLTRMLILASSGLFLAACAGPDAGKPAVGEQKSEPSAAAPPSMAARKEALAPIESAEIIVRESSPPQYALRVVSGLPSGCAKFGRIEVKRQEAVFEVTVWNTVPANSDVMCTMIYGTADHTANLEGEFKPGQTYTVRVNGEQKTSFTAQ